MDVHGDNIVLTSAGLRLIDWEYAGDGDDCVGELAAVWVEDERQRDNWRTLMQRARESTPGSYGDGPLWHPRVIMLKAGWFEYRWPATNRRATICREAGR